ncbi:MAG: bifunctional anthranilate synthase component II/anthranilate phosphoribosyltransferase [Chloroflexi bacterium]|nr:bifunctional anthranilate synthase component II/anthranilate phosphoribosyltransferase [Chloroflexota bacterium]
MIAVIDNYDSFTYNLVQYLGELGAEVRVFRNDAITVDSLERTAPSHLIVSPGPGTPEHDAGISNEAIRRLHGRIPILGVCLGHQCIAHVFGGRVSRAAVPMHGKVSRITHQGGTLFDGIASAFDATRYHSLTVEEPLPDVLRITARASDGDIMGIEHRDAPTMGVQFHPESILTRDGKRMLANLLSLGTERQTNRVAEASLTLPSAIQRALERNHLTSAQAEAVMMQIMDGQATPAQIGAFLAALRAKGETIDEIVGMARGMRKHATLVRTTRQPLIDTCGTGGDGAHTFNISTTAAFVVAAAGVAVAKHGNRSVSSQAGSADVLQALGIRLDLSPEQVGRCIDEVGFGFLFAPALHPAMKHAIGPRREMSVRTVFNVLGPLTNPAEASLQLIGVYDRTLVEPLAHVLADLGSEAAMVVSSADGLDELSITGANLVAELKQGTVSTYVLDPAEYGLSRASLNDIRGGSAEDNAVITREVLAGQRSPRRDMVLLNAAAALRIAGCVADVRAGLALAAEIIDTGRATAVLDRLIAYTQGAA